MACRKERGKTPMLRREPEPLDTVERGGGRGKGEKDDVPLPGSMMSEYEEKNK